MNADDYLKHQLHYCLQYTSTLSVIPSAPICPYPGLCYWSSCCNGMKAVYCITNCWLIFIPLNCFTSTPIPPLIFITSYFTGLDLDFSTSYFTKTRLRFQTSVFLEISLLLFPTIVNIYTLFLYQFPSFLLITP